MKQHQSDDFELFYQEVPLSDYLDDIEIDDNFEDSVIDPAQGLSEDQVSEIARDSLDQKFKPSSSTHRDATVDDTTDHD